MCCDSHAAAYALGTEQPYAGSALHWLAERHCSTGPIVHALMKGWSLQVLGVGLH